MCIHLYVGIAINKISHLMATELVIRDFKSMYSRSKKYDKTTIYFNTNYHTKMKLVPVIMD